MARKKGPSKTYLCQNCGEDFPKWYGRCPNCGEWNSLVVYRPPKTGPGAGHRAAAGAGGAPDRGLGIPGRSRRGPQERARATGWIPPEADALVSADVKLLAEVHGEDAQRLTSGIGEFDRVLGGGLVPGSVVLVGGDPGVGKSTLLLQVASELVRQGRGVLYVSGEESAGQIRLRAERLGATGNLPVLAEADLERILEAVSNGVYRALPSDPDRPELEPETEEEPAPVEVLVIDSIQATYLPELPSAPGSLLQVREGALALTRSAKARHMAVLLIGHMTKEGHLAGPRTLEHIVDAVLTMEGDRFQAHRILRSNKNRFGSVHEIGVFDMRERGLREVANPSELFLGEDAGRATGSVVVASIEGTRSLLMEVQALVHPTRYGIPQRVATGFDGRRLAILLPVLIKRGGLDVTSSDVFVNVTGGLRVEEPGVDLGILLAVASSLRDRSLGDDLAVFGEIGLGGEVRRAAHPERRIAEAARLGCRRILAPAATLRDLEARGWQAPDGIRLLGVSGLEEALRAVLGATARRRAPGGGLSDEETWTPEPARGAEERGERDHGR